MALGLEEGKYLDSEAFPDNEIKEIVLSRNKGLKQLDWQQEELKLKNVKLTRINSTMHHMMKFLVSSHFDQPGLKKSVEILCSLVDARYGVALTYNERGEITAFASNLSAEDEQKIGRLPSGPGILGIKLKKGEVLNLEDQTKHPLFTGFPRHHPVLKSLLVVPIWVKDQYFGKIYLSDKKNGERFTAEDEELVVTFANSLALAAENNRLLKALQEAEELYRITVNTLPTGILVVSQDNQIILANQKLSEFTGDNPEKALGKSLEEVLGWYELSEGLHKFRKERKPYDFCQLGYSGEESSGKRDFLVFLSLLSYPEGEQEIVIVLEDITARLRLQKDQELLKEKLYHSEKLAALGRLLAGVAHELNNPLAVILGNSELLTLGDLDERVGKRIQTIIKAAERCKKIVANLLSFSRKTQPNKEQVNLNTVIEATLEFKNNELKLNNIDLVKELDEKLPDTLVDPTQFQQVLLNLLENAQHALLQNPREKTVKIKTYSQADKTFIQVADNGGGIPPENLNKVFEPFFTTKEVGKGTGLGLSVVHGIIEGHQGDMQVESKLGAGTTFTIQLPILQEEGAKSEEFTPAPPTDAQAKTGQRKILVIDDEVDILDLISDFLTDQGHEVVSAQEGVNALGKLAGSNFDLIISDIKMPGMDGEKLYQTLAHKNPAYKDKIIFITGDVVNSETARFLAESGCRFLRKPFGLEELEGILEQTFCAVSSTRNQGN